MPSSTAPDFVPLTGADCFLRAFDDEVRRYNCASHVSQLVLRLGPGFDVGAFRDLLAEVARANPIVHAPIGRRFLVGSPVYRMAAANRSPLPRIEVTDAEDAPLDASLPPRFCARMNEPFGIRRGDLLRFDVVRYGGGRRGTDLAMSWLHMLFDGSGSETFLRWLEDCRSGARRPDDVSELEEVGSRVGNGADLTLAARGKKAGAWQALVRGVAARAPRSLAGPLRREPQDLRYRVDTLSPEETARAVDGAKMTAGFLTPMLFYLAAAIRAHHAVFKARGLDPRSYVVPLPVNLRPKGGGESMFRTHVSMLWFQVVPDLVEDFDALVAALKQQRRTSIKNGLVECGVHAMDFARFVPQRLYARMTRRGFGGELCSFFFAYTDEFLPGLDRFLGAEIRNGFHAPAVPPSPGSCAAMSLRKGRLNATHVYQRRVFSDDELALFRERLIDDLTGGSLTGNRRPDDPMTTFLRSDGR
jgi:hypothetical protein